MASCHSSQLVLNYPSSIYILSLAHQKIANQIQGEANQFSATQKTANQTFKNKIFPDYPLRMFYEIHVVIIVHIPSISWITDIFLRIISDWVTNTIIYVSLICNILNMIMNQFVTLQDIRNFLSFRTTALLSFYVICLQRSVFKSISKKFCTMYVYHVNNYCKSYFDFEDKEQLIFKRLV